MSDSKRQDPPAGSTKQHCHPESGSGWSPGLGFQWLPGDPKPDQQKPTKRGCLVPATLVAVLCLTLTRST